MAKEKPYRCQNPRCSTDDAGRLIYDFWAQRPVCPKCGTDAAKMPNVVIELAVVHFDPPSEVFGRGLRIVACTGKHYGGREQVTGHPGSVNCRECRATDAWLDAADARGNEVLVTPESPAAQTVFEIAAQEIGRIAAEQELTLEMLEPENQLSQ